MKIKSIFGIVTTLIVFAILFNSIAIAAKKNDDQGQKDISKSTETLDMNWPKNGQWKSGMKQTFGQTTIEFFYPKDQSKNNWSESGSIEIRPTSKEVPIVSTARNVFLGTQKASPKATWDILEQGKFEDGNKYIIIEIICPEYRTKDEPQIQYWKVIEGRVMTYFIQYSHKGTTISDEKKVEILGAIKNAKLIKAKKI